MKRGYVYTIVFMLIVSSVFTFFLAGTDALTTDRIAENARRDEIEAVLYVFGLETGGSDEEREARFNEAVRAIEGEEFDYYTHEEDGEILAYAVPYTNSALWGSISGFMAVTPDLDEVVGLVFTEQNETPGLGGRIMEPWFTDQFRGLRLDAAGTLSYGVQDSGLEIDAITGATQTSNAILRIINDVRAETLPLLEVD